MIQTKIYNNIKSKIKLFYDIFIVPSWVYFPPQKCDILIYDECGSEALLPYLKNYRVEILSVRGESINVYCLLVAIFKKKFWRGEEIKAYEDSFITSAIPRLCITFIDNNTAFYNISNRFDGLKTMLLQNGLRDDWLKDSANNYKYKVDFMLVFNDLIGSIYQKHINGNIVLAGSLKNNSIAVTDNNMLILLSNGQKVSWDDFCKCERIVLKNLERWCRYNKKKLSIAGCVLGNSVYEIEYFESILGKSEWCYIPRVDIYSTYTKIDSAEIVVNIDSTMGHESISRGKKLPFFHFEVCI